MRLNPTLLRAAIAGLSGVADYYSKANLFPAVGMNFNGYGAYIAGAAGGRAAYSGALYLLGASASPTSTFARGAGYAIASDVLLSYLDKNFANNKAYQYFATTSNKISSTFTPEVPVLCGRPCRSIAFII